MERSKMADLGFGLQGARNINIIININLGQGVLGMEFGFGRVELEALVACVSVAECGLSRELGA